MEMRPLIVVMGVSGCGKSTLASRLAQVLRVPFCEGDRFHTSASVAKMHAGIALDDLDRSPWLKRCTAWLRRQAKGGVLSCSALRRSYRDQLRSGAAGNLSFVFLDPPLEVLEHRVRGRTGHFMSAELLGSQLATLERPSGDEHALWLAGDVPEMSAVRSVVDWLWTGGRDACAGP